MAKPKIKIEKITPSMAAQMLKKNTCNRNLNERFVSRLVRAIKQDEWKMNGDAIRLATDGTLLDGQHRLSAVVVSKKPIESLVIRNLPKAVMDTIDIGNRRSLGNHLQMAGYKGSVFAIAAAVGICLEFKRGVFTEVRDRTSPQEMLDYLKSNKRLLASADIYTSAAYQDFRSLIPQSVSVACHHLFTQIDKEKGETFFHHLVKGENLGKTSPILKLRNELIGLRSQSKRGDFSRKIFLHYMTTAFQAYLHDKRVEELPEYKTTVKILLPKV